MAFSRIQEYINTGDGTAGTLLIPKLILPPMIEAAEKALLPREMAAFVKTNIPGSSFSVNLETPDSMSIEEVGEGVEVMLSKQDYSSVTFTPVKYGVAIRITREMMEDSQFDLLEANLRTAGKRFSENETQLILSALDGANATTAGGVAITIANIAESMYDVRSNDYNATDFIFGDEILQDLQNIDTFVEADKAGNTQLMSTGFIGAIFGMKCARFSSSTKVCPSTSHPKYGYIFDRAQTYGIAIKRDITVENVTLPTYDMEGAVITQRIDVQLLRSKAVSRITTS